jgi:hypothetical protein
LVKLVFRPAAKRPIFNLRAFARGLARPPKNLRHRATPIYRPMLWTAPGSPHFRPSSIELVELVGTSR